MSKSFTVRSPSLAFLIALCCSAATSRASITYPVAFSDPGETYAAYYSEITTSLQAAGARWGQVLSGSGSLEIQVEFTTGISTLDGASFTSGFVHKNGSRDVYEQGAAYEIRTGTDPNGSTPDIRIRINPNYLASEMWFDPDPSSRTAPIPANHQDALSLFIHELGHAFVFSGFMNGTTGALPATYESTFDEQVQFDGSNFYFVGSSTKSVYGGPVPLTYGNYGHVGNSAPRPGSDLLNDLMNGVSYTFGMRYDISALDLAIAKDVGLVVIPPAQLQNISTRLKVLTGDNVLIGGFIISGPSGSTKKVLVRGLGPSLSGFGVPDTLADPLLQLNGPGTAITNDDWQSDPNMSQIPPGFAPSNPKESAIVATLGPGNYTAILKGADGGSGNGLAEVYDIDGSSPLKIGNISTRGFVQSGDNVMIGGFFIGGSGSVTVVVRALGPSLTQFGVVGAMQDPTLEVHDGNGNTTTNDDWQSAGNSSSIPANLQPTDPRESALLMTLVPGQYTAIVRGKNETGVALVEVYNLN